VPPVAVPVEIRRRVPLQIVSSCAEPPEGDGWLHEVKHDGHRLIAVAEAAGLRLISRNGYDRTESSGIEACRVSSKTTTAGSRALGRNRGSRHRTELAVGDRRGHIAEWL